jgi:cytochrome P450
MESARPVVEFDHHSAEYARNWRVIDRELREKHPVAWSEAHGGFWILSRYADARQAAADWQTFSSENDVSGTGNGGHGIMVPPNPFQFALSESDPPQSTAIRKIYTPHFMAKAVERQRSVAEAFAKESIDRVARVGEVDFVHDIAIEVPARTVLKIVGVPDDEWRLFALSAHDMSRLPSSDPAYPHEQIGQIMQKLSELVRDRRHSPREDLLSVLVQAELFGQPMSDEMAVGIISAAVFGGFDTATTSILNMLLLLDEQPELKEVLLQNPSKYTNAIDETLRLYPPGHVLGRTVMRDVEVGGQLLRKGERVLMLWSAANRDPEKFTNPDMFDIDRPNAGQHLTFSFGGHRCLGSLLGKMEVEVTIRMILERIGDYRVDREGIVRYDTIGNIDGFAHMPAHFTPERAVAVAE